jgi:3-oxoacyl-[acyl-carrier protein] reductase
MAGQETRRRAVITGGARGLGRSVALMLAQHKFEIALVDLGDAPLADVEQEVAQAGGHAVSFICDVTDHAAIQAASARILDALGGVDVLVNNAGRSQPKPISELSEEEWDGTINVNLKSQFSWSKALSPSMVKQGSGRIINISSMSGHTGGAWPAVSKAAYAAAKAGVIGFTKGLARELAPAVRVNAICPGIMVTRLAEAYFGPDVRDRILGDIPLGRFGTPEDVAEVVVFLATAERAFLTGEIIDVDGGQWMN